MVDLCVASTTYVDLASLHELATLSGGAVFLYRSLEQSTLPQVREAPGSLKKSGRGRGNRSVGVTGTRLVHLPRCSPRLIATAYLRTTLQVRLGEARLSAGALARRGARATGAALARGAHRGSARRRGVAARRTS